MEDENRGYKTSGGGGSKIKIRVGEKIEEYPNSLV